MLAVIAGAFRDLLVSRGDPVDHVVLRSLVPVSVRATDDHTANNQVSASIVELPIGVADPLERLEATRRQMDALKASHQADASGAMTSMAAFTAPMLYALGLRSGTTAFRYLPQRSVNTVTTNVPGPRYPALCPRTGDARVPAVRARSRRVSGSVFPSCRTTARFASA